MVEEAGIAYDALAPTFPQDTDRKAIVDTVLYIIGIKALSAQVLSEPMVKLLKEGGLTIKETVFCTIFAGAMINANGELVEPQPHLTLHSREEFVNLAGLAFDYMQLQHKGRMKSDGLAPPNDH